VLVAPSSLMSVSSGAVGEASAGELLQALAKVPDPRDPRGARQRLATLLAIAVCAMPAAGHNSLVAIAEWARRCDQEVLARPGCPFDPFAGRYRSPGERTLRYAFAKVDPGALTAAGFARAGAARRRTAEPRRCPRANSAVPTERPSLPRTRPGSGGGRSPWTASACRISGQVGFGSPTAFRDRFKRTTGVSHHTYRRTFR
jgi:hypothetical protein